MPIYQYQCENCNNTFEKLVSKPSNKKDICPKCSSPAKKIEVPEHTTFILKGSGWAADSYTSKK